MPDHVLYLEIPGFTDHDHWRWTLLDSHRTFLADHTVALDPAHSYYHALFDLEGYLKQNTAPDKWLQEQTDLLGRIGAWLGTTLLGPIADKILQHGTPSVVRVIVPPYADGLLYFPLELAHANGKPLSLQDVSFVFEVAEEAPSIITAPIGDKLRVLAVFSLPTEASALALRRERYELERLLQRIAQTHHRAIELRVLQYGVTRDRLQEVMEDGEGWDILHFSGHGLQAALVLEKADGSLDPIGSLELCDLLKPARGRLKLVTLSACLSAAATIQETLRWLGVESEQKLTVSETEAADKKVLPAVARVLVRELGCATVAMRYPVGDSFAIALSEHLYEGMLGNGQTLTRALQLALPRAAGLHPSPGAPPLSVATPTLFGPHAVGLTLLPPAAQGTTFTTDPRLVDYVSHAEPTYFVGRVGPLARASQVLAPQSDKRGVLFHGMAGGGKTACALELAHRYRTHRFQAFVWYKAPDRASDIATALSNLAQHMEERLPGLKMVHLVDREEEFEAWLPQLTGLLAAHSILLVLDNLESLLTPEGKWRDARWGKLVAALLAHDGYSRTLLTSRIRPADLDPNRVLIEPVHALTRNETVVLARELPHLGKLLETGREEGRQLVHRALELVQGHPKLLEFADLQAHDPAALAAHLDKITATSSPDEGRLKAFFRTGKSSLGPDDFLATLAAWTRDLVATLSPASRDLFHFLCCVEEVDRQNQIIAANWGDLWRRLERKGEVPPLDNTLKPLVNSGLVEVVPLDENTSLYRLHPGVAETGLAQAGETFRAAADRELAGFWVAGQRQGRETESQGGGMLIVTAGLSAAPYLLRLQEWEMTAYVVEEALSRDGSPSTATSALAWFRIIAEATRDTDKGLENLGIVGKALRACGRSVEAEEILREVVRRSVERGDFRVASATCGELVQICMEADRLNEALEVVEQKVEYTRRAGLGPWTQLGNEGRRLQVLASLGRYEDVLSAVEELRGQMSNLAEESDQEETAQPWNVREAILDTGHTATLLLERWEEALALNAEIVALTIARGATALELAHTRFNDQGPLRRLERYAEAGTLLTDCRRVYEEAGDLLGLARVFTALAGLKDGLQNPGQAVHFEQTALRYKYLAAGPESISISHFNFANYLLNSNGPARAALAHRLAAVIIDYQTNSGRLVSHMAALVRHLTVRDLAPHLPASFDEVYQIVEQVEGVHFRELFAQLPARAESGEAAYKAVLTLARQRRA